MHLTSAVSCVALLMKVARFIEIKKRWIWVSWILIAGNCGSDCEPMVFFLQSIVSMIYFQLCIVSPKWCNMWVHLCCLWINQHVESQIYLICLLVNLTHSHFYVQMQTLTCAIDWRSGLHLCQKHCFLNKLCRICATFMQEVLAWFNNAGSGLSTWM